MNNKFKIIIISLFFLSLTILFLSNAVPNFVKADALSDNIKQQVEKIDFSELETFFNDNFDYQDNNSFFNNLTKLLKGEYEYDLSSVLEYLIKFVFNDVFVFLPTFLCVLSISLICSILQHVKSSFVTEGVAEISFFICMMSIILMLSAEIISFYENTKITIETIAKLTEIMSPIMLTLMLAVGGNVSASVYTPTVAFLSGNVINIILSIVLPLVGIMTIFSIASNFSYSIKLNKFSEFTVSIIKWIIGIIITVYSLFLSVQGLTSATFDGISIKAAKYALSNSIPIVGGFIKDGFDLVVAGSVLIKNSVGILVIFSIFFVIISPILTMSVFSLLLKLVAGIIEPISDVRISNFCFSLSKTISYLIACVFVVGLMLFITVLLMIFSANVFV